MCTCVCINVVFLMQFKLKTLLLSLELVKLTVTDFASATLTLNELVQIIAPRSDMWLSLIDRQCKHERFLNSFFSTAFFFDDL